MVPLGNEGICEDCRGQLSYIEEPRCFLCGREIASYEEELCDDCAKVKRFFDGGYPLFNYVPPVSDSVASIKYMGRQEYIEFYAGEMAKAYGDTFYSLGIEALIPIPIHRKRMKRRGFNQAALLAEEISKRIGIPVLDALERTVDTLPQKNLGNEERLKNLEKVFKVKEQISIPERVVVTDDIFTTGATVSAAAKLLKKAGAKKVYFTSICRA